MSKSSKKVNYNKKPIDILQAEIITNSCEFPYFLNSETDKRIAMLYSNAMQILIKLLPKEVLDNTIEDINGSIGICTDEIEYINKDKHELILNLITDHINRYIEYSSKKNLIHVITNLNRLKDYKIDNALYR